MASKKAEVQKTSWTMGSSAWEPEPASASDYKWPEKMERAKPFGAKKEGRTSNVQLGVDSKSRYTSASAAAFAPPRTGGGAGRQKPAKPDTSTSISLGSTPTDYTSSSAAAYTVAAEYKGPKAQAAAAGGGAEMARRSNLVLGDDATDYTTTQASQNSAGATVDVAGRKAVRAEMEDRKRVLATKNISFGSDATPYTTTAKDAMLKEVPKKEPRRKVNMQRTSLVLGDDATEYQTQQMAAEGLRTKKLGVPFNPRKGASCKRDF